MKKLLTVLSIIFCASTSFAASAVGYSGHTYNNSYASSSLPNTKAVDIGLVEGSQLFSIYLGGSAALNKVHGLEVETSFGTEELDWGSAALSYGLSYQYVINPYLALGAEFNGNNFAGEDIESWGFISGWPVKDTLKTEMGVYNFFMAGRITGNPYSTVRFYVPFGIGLTLAQAAVKHTQDLVGGLSFDEKSRHTTNSLGWYAGLGLEGDFSNNMFWGGEVRYQSFQYDLSKMASDLGGRRSYGFLAFLLKLGIKF